MDKQNKAARAARKKEDNQRIRQLVDNAYATDPRIKKFKEEEKRKKFVLLFVFFSVLIILTCCVHVLEKKQKKKKPKQ